MVAFQVFPEITAFLDRLPRKQIIDEIVSEGMDRGASEQRLDTYFNEVHVGYAAIAPYALANSRILEVGAGLGLLSAFLVQQGYQVTSLEPAATGFDFFSVTRNAVLRHLTQRPEQTLEVSAEVLDPAQHGLFDFVFSIHVLEHMDHLDGAFAAMTRVLKPGGRMVHLCPNYAFPYDPHFGIPLLPGRPNLTAGLLPKRITETDLWRSLNFVSAAKLSQLAAEHGLDARFKGGQLASMIRRVQEDPVFAARHSGFVSAMLKATRIFRIEHIAKAIPAWLDSPMLVELQFNGDRSAAS